MFRFGARWSHYSSVWNCCKYDYSLVSTMEHQGIKGRARSAMRGARPFYLVPFFVYFALLFCSTTLLTIVDSQTREDASYPLPAWFLFASLAVFTPASLAVSQVMPSPTLTLVTGGLMTSLGLLWTGLDSGQSTMLSYCILAGSGMSLVLQASAVTVSPYFIRTKVTTSAFVLGFCMALVLTVHQGMARLSQHYSSGLFLCLSGLALVSTLVPVVGHWCVREVEEVNDEEEEVDMCVQLTEILPMKETPQPVESLPEETSGFMEAMQLSVKRLLVTDTWSASLVAGAMWVSWGAGIDTTWLSLGLRPSYDADTLTCLQLLISFTVLLCKLVHQYMRTTPGYMCPQVNLSSNYMHLGLIGCAGVGLCLFPEACSVYHNQLLFTVSLAMQYDDVSDLHLVRHRDNGRDVMYYKVATCDIETDTAEPPATDANRPMGALVSLACLLCHVMTLVVMALLAMVLGIQLANLFGFLSTLPPLSYVFTRGGMLVMSVFSVGVSLSRPDVWIRNNRYNTIITT